MEKETRRCCNCGQELSAENIRLAYQEVGQNPDELFFNCPAYQSDTDTCPLYTAADQTKPAWWAY